MSVFFKVLFFKSMTLCLRDTSILILAAGAVGFHFHSGLVYSQQNTLYTITYLCFAVRLDGFQFFSHGN